MVVLSEEFIDEHLRIVEVCENGHSVVIGDLPLIEVNAEHIAKEIVVGDNIGIKIIDLRTKIGVVEIEVYHVMGSAVAISFVAHLRGCGHNLRDIYSYVLDLLRSGERSG